MDPTPFGKPGRRPAPLPAELAGRAFAYSEALEHGVSAERLRGKCFVRLHRQIYADNSVDVLDEDVARAWMRVLPPDAALYGRTAAEWYGMPVLPSAEFQIIVPAGTVPRRRPGLEPHEGLRDEDVTDVRGIRITTPERTWLDLAATLSDADLLAVGDAMVGRGLTTPERLIEVSVKERRRRQIVRARRLARLVRCGVDSPPESWVRLALVDAGLPMPTVNPDVTDESGQWIGRPDLANEELRVAIQYEGDVHRTNAKRWRADISRDEVMRQHGWEVVRVTADDLRRPWRLVVRVRSALARQRERLGDVR